MRTSVTAVALADITEELAAQFDGRLTETCLARMVRHCRRELTITDGSAEPDAVLHLAQQRLKRLDARRQPAPQPGRGSSVEDQQTGCGWA